MAGANQTQIISKTNMHTITNGENNDLSGDMNQFGMKQSKSSMHKNNTNKKPGGV
jgi:hypothetical protein